jgi:hypothetical protein
MVERFIAILQACFGARVRETCRATRVEISGG